VATADVVDLANIHPLFTDIIPLLECGVRTKYRPGQGHAIATTGDITIFRAEIQEVLDWWKNFVARKFRQDNFTPFFHPQLPNQALEAYV
jgi:hypothetical protein